MRTMLRDKYLVGSIALLCIAQVLLFARVHSLSRAAPSEPLYHALNVGQGDATLIELADGTRVLTDAGPDGSVVAQVGAVLANDRYIDLGVITHLQKDHMYGFVPLLRQYRFGAIVWNGRTDAGSPNDWKTLVALAAKEHIPLIRVAAGDRVRTRGGTISILSPPPEYVESAELNDTCVVELVRTNRWSALLTGDIDSVLEGRLIERYGTALHADILKVPHHGSKYSSTEAFIQTVRPQVATISVGAKNHYGHPNQDVIARYEADHVRVFRTDKAGTVTLRASPGGIERVTSSPP
jgi:competence protein ComEC